MENSSEDGPQLIDQKLETNGTTNGAKEESEATEPEEPPVQSSKGKVQSEDVTEESPKETEEDSDHPVEKPAVPTSETEGEEPTPTEEEADASAAEVSEEAPACTVADLIDEEEEESPKMDEDSSKIEEEDNSKMEEEDSPKIEEEDSPKIEDEESPKVEDDEKPVSEKGEATEEESEKVESVDEEKEEEEEVDEPPTSEENKKEEARSVKQDTKTAAELAYEWDDDGIEDEKPSPSKTPKKKSESKPKASPVVDVTPGRKSSRTPKPTQRKLESESQKNLKETEEDEEDDGDEEDEESVDAIAKELEKSDSDKSPGSGGKKVSAKKGKKPVNEEKSKEEWVNLIFGENGEKVTEKGVKGGKTGDETGAKDSKAEDGEGPDSEEFLPEDTPKTKKGGRPKKKGLDETLDGVAKLGSNMYFYTGPGGSDSPPPLDSDEEDLPIKKADSEPARKSSRANKGRNTRLERGDEVVDIPQVKEAPKPNLNPSWLKNHDSKSSPAKKGSTPVVKAVVKPAPAKAPEKKETKKEKEKEDEPEDKKDKVEEEENEEPMDTEEIPEVPKDTKAPVEDSITEEEEKSTEDSKGTTPTPDDAALEFDPDKFAPGYVPKTVKKGEDEYVIVVSGVKDTGLCGNYWNVSEGGRRRSKPPETLQMGKEKRRGSVGSVGSETSGKDSPVSKKGAATPASAKSGKKQVTKPEKVETEDVEESKTPVGRGRKRKTEETPASKSKSVKKGAEDDTKEFSDYDSGNNETQPLRKRPKKEDGEGPEAAAGLTTKQQSAVAAALAAGVPGGQQRSVSCVADTNTQKEVVVECFAPYDDHRWVNIGKERDGMAPDAVQYARALRPPYHLLSFLRIKGHSTKGMSCTDKNTMVFVVLEGEITVILHTTQFNAKKGDSFYIPPKNYYNLINQKAREAELSLIQFQYDGPLPTVQPSNG